MSDAAVRAKTGCAWDQRVRVLDAVDASSMPHREIAGHVREQFTWQDGTSVEVYFAAKGEKKSQVTVQHRKLASKTDNERLREYWTGRLAALADILVPSKQADQANDGCIDRPGRRPGPAP